MERDFKGIWISKEVWLDKRLNALEKIILMEIDSFDDGEEGCDVSNQYLSEFCQCSETKVSNAISKLIDLGYLELKSFNGRVRILRSSLTEKGRQPDGKREAEIPLSSSVSSFSSPLTLNSINIINNSHHDNRKMTNRIGPRKDSPQSEIAPTQDEPEIDTILDKKPADFNPLDFIEHQNSSTVSFVEKEKENTPHIPSNEKDTAEEIDAEEFSELFQNPEREDTSKFLSKKMSTEDAQEVLDYWNSKDIIKHRKFTQDYLKNFSLISEKYPVEKIKEAINNYSIVLKTSDFWTYKWTLEDFIRLDKKDTSPCEDFFNEGKHWINFGKKYPGVKKNIAANIYTHKEIRDAALKGELSPEMVKKFLEEQRQKSIEASKVKNKIYI